MIFLTLFGYLDEYIIFQIVYNISNAYWHHLGFCVMEFNFITSSGIYGDYSSSESRFITSRSRFAVSCERLMTPMKRSSADTTGSHSRFDFCIFCKTSPLSSDGVTASLPSVKLGGGYPRSWSVD